MSEEKYVCIEKAFFRNRLYKRGDRLPYAKDVADNSNFMPEPEAKEYFIDRTKKKGKKSSEPKTFKDLAEEEAQGVTSAEQVLEELNKTEGGDLSSSVKIVDAPEGEAPAAPEGEAPAAPEGEAPAAPSMLG